MPHGHISADLFGVKYIHDSDGNVIRFTTGWYPERVKLGSGLSYTLDETNRIVTLAASPFTVPAAGFDFANGDAGISAQGLPLIHGFDDGYGYHPLVGGGLYTIEMSNSRNTSEITVEEDGSLNTGYRRWIIKTSGPVTMTVPDAADCPIGTEFDIKRKGAGTVVLTGGFTLNLTTDNQSVRIVRCNIDGTPSWESFS